MAKNRIEKHIGNGKSPYKHHSTDDKRDENMYTHQRKELKKAGGYITVKREWPAAIGAWEAFTVSGLLNIGCMVNNDGFKNIDGNPYFWCSRQRVCNEIAISDGQERGVMASLARLGIVKRKMIGMPARRYIYIDLRRLQELVDANNR